MSSKATMWIWIILIIIVLAGGYYFWSASQAPSMTDTQQTASTTLPAQTDATASSTTATPTTVTVSYDGHAFSPFTVTIHAGDTVNFVSSTNMWLASDPHPVHSGYDGTTRTQHCAPGYTGAAPFDECAAGTSFSFTFTKVGSWGYHDHLNDDAHGTVIVQ